jgi:Holliday junction resolvase RusA-like endonuclease
MEVFLEFFVPGIPRPAGSKRAFAIRRRNGHLGVAVSDMSGEAGKAWRSDLIGFATHAMIGKEPLVFGPIALEVTFVLPRPKNHYGRKGLKESAPHWHIIRPDISKLLRAVEDALTGTVWKDDAQIVYQSVSKHYGPKPGAGIRIYQLTDDCACLLDFPTSKLILH